MVAPVVQHSAFSAVRVLPHSLHYCGVIPLIPNAPAMVAMMVPITFSMVFQVFFVIFMLFDFFLMVNVSYLHPDGT